MIKPRIIEFKEFLFIKFQARSTPSLVNWKCQFPICTNNESQLSHMIRISFINFLEWKTSLSLVDFQEEISRFRVPPCPNCSGVLKPYIVFYGDNVPRDRVQFVKDRLAQCDAFLALGTSLQVYSAFRSDWLLSMSAKAINQFFPSDSIQNEVYFLYSGKNGLMWDHHIPHSYGHSPTSNLQHS